MAKGKARDKSKEAFWRKAMAAYQRSGLQICQFCRREKLHETAFYFWRRELARRNTESRPAAKSPVHKRKTCPPKPQQRRMLFVPVSVVTEARPVSGEIAIALADGCRIHLTPPVDRQSLRDVLAALETPPC